MRTKLVKARTGYYEIRFSEGKRSRTVSTRTRSRPEAEAFRRAWVNAQRNAPAASEPTVAELVDDYEALHVKPARVRSTQGYTLKPIRAFFGALKPAEIGPATVEDYRAERVSLKRKDGTIRRELGALSTVLNWAVKHKKLDRASVPVIDRPPDGQARLTYLDENEEPVFHAQAMGLAVGEARLPRLTRFIGIALDTGARKEAIEGLTWDRVDLKQGLIDFRDPTVKSTKKRRVVVPISDRLAPLLERASREATGPFVLDHPGDTRKSWETFRKRTSRPRLGIHDLRRTWASLAMIHGVDVAFVAAVLGDTVEIVLKHYGHLRPDHLRGAVNARWRKDDD